MEIGESYKIPSKDRAYIYGLLDDRDGIIRYVGKSVAPVNRLYLHLYEAYEYAPLGRWLLNLLKEGQTPTLIILDHAPTDTALTIEKEWITKQRAIYPGLFNRTPGNSRGENHRKIRVTDE